MSSLKREDNEIGSLELISICKGLNGCIYLCFNKPTMKLGIFASIFREFLNFQCHTFESVSIKTI